MDGVILYSQMVHQAVETLSALFRAEIDGFYLASSKS
jgi:hypothetical protein